jgi:hypothetical protein
MDFEYIYKDIIEFSNSEGKCLYAWTAEEGLYEEHNKSAFAGTIHPNITLQMIRFFSLTNKDSSLFVLYEFHHHLNDTSNERLFIELLEALKDSSHKVVLIFQEYCISTEIKPYVAHISTGFPTVKEIKKILVNLLKEVIRVNKIFKIQLIPEEQKKFIQSLNGLNENQIKEFMNHDLLDGVLNADDIEKLLYFKKKTFDKEGFLEFCMAEQMDQMAVLKK